MGEVGYAWRVRDGGNQITFYRFIPGEPLDEFHAGHAPFFRISIGPRIGKAFTLQLAYIGTPLLEGRQTFGIYTNNGYELGADITRRAFQGLQLNLGLFVDG